MVNSSLNKKRRTIGLTISILAIFFILLSGFISFFIVRQNDPIISSLRMDVLSKQDLIKDIWNNVLRMESRIDTAILIEIMEKEFDHKILLKSRYLSEFGNLTVDSGVQDILLALEREKQIKIDHINQLYLEQANIQNKITSLENTNKKYSELAFLLQLITLVLLVIKKDAS